MQTNNSGIKKILIKISGESLKPTDGKEILDKSTIFNFIKQIKELYKSNFKLAIVVGGGNIWRGKIASKIGIDSFTGDYMGMLATIINGLAIQRLLQKENLPCKLYSSIFAPNVSNNINYNNFINDFDSNILIFSGGVGEPNFSTDSCAAIRALELECDILLLGKNGTDGVYDKDPNIYENAKFYKNLTYEEIINKNLKVMDLTALTLCKNSNIEIRVFNINEKNAFLDVLKNKMKYTKIKD